MIISHHASNRWASNTDQPEGAYSLVYTLYVRGNHLSRYLSHVMTAVAQQGSFFQRKRGDVSKNATVTASAVLSNSDC